MDNFDNLWKGLKEQVAKARTNPTDMHSTKAGDSVLTDRQVVVAKSIVQDAAFVGVRGHGFEASTFLSADQLLDVAANCIAVAQDIQSKKHKQLQRA